MGRTEQLKPRTICWDESVKPAKTRQESNIDRAESQKQKAQRLKYLIGDRSGISPHAKQTQATLAPDIREIHPIDRQPTPCKHRIPRTVSKAITIWCINTKSYKCPQLNSSVSGRSIDSPDKNQSCLFCRMESPSGGIHNSWCKKFVSLTEIYSQYNSTVSSRMKQREQVHQYIEPDTTCVPKMLVNPLCKDARFIPRRAGPSPTTPPPQTPPPPPATADHPKNTPKPEDLPRYRSIAPTSTGMPKISQVVEYRFADTGGSSEGPLFLPSIDQHVTEGALFKPHFLTKHKEITVSPAIGQEFVVEKLGLKLRMPHINENWSNTSPKKRNKPRPFLSQVGRTLPPMVFKAPDNIYLHKNSFDSNLVEKRFNLSGDHAEKDIENYTEKLAKQYSVQERPSSICSSNCGTFDSKTLLI